MSTPENAGQQMMGEVWASQVRSRAAAVAAGLRKIADEVEREASALDRIGQQEFTTYGYVAGQVIHAVTWGVANLHLDQLAQRAADADAARIGAGTESQEQSGADRAANG